MRRLIPTATQTNKPARLWNRYCLLWVALACASCQPASQLPLSNANQRLLTADVEQVIDSQISKDISRRHYNRQETDEIYCVHNQTHLRNPDNGERLVLYAKIVCAASSPGASPDNKRHKDLSQLITLPIRVEIEVDDKDFEVLGWQFPRGVETYAQDAARIFPPRLLPEITGTVMKLEHFDRLREKVDTEKG